MGGYISLAATRGCRATLIFTTAALACCALLLPFTGAQLILPAALGAAMLGVGLFVVYRTRRRGN